MLTTTFVFLFLFYILFCVFYKVTSHHLSLNTEAELTDRQAGRRVDVCLWFKVDILLHERLKVRQLGCTIHV